jgi:cytosine/adenosine deaminase-related metal-dependent hydrolase
VEAARRNGWRVHTHLAEVREEITEARIAYGTNTLGRARDFGVLDLDTIYAHCVWLNEGDISLLAASTAAVAHNPVSNMILGSGVCPVPRLRMAGLPVGLGTDGAASNDSHDMLQVLKFAALIQKLNSLDPAVLTARDVLAMGTIEGARSLCLDDRIGSLEPGKLADIVHLRGDSTRLAYVHDPYQQLVYCASPADVANVWVNGRRVVADHAVVTVNEREVVAQARRLARDLFQRAGLADVLRRDRLAGGGLMMR